MVLRVSISALAAAVLVGCGFEPEVPTFQWEVSEAARAKFSVAGVPAPELAAARLEGSLQSLFGTPSAPGYYLLDDWVDEYRDPNDAWWELSDDAVDAVRADNARRFGDQIAALEGAFADAPDEARPIDVPAPRSAPAAFARFEDSFAPLLDGEAAPTDLHPDSPAEDEADDEYPTFTWGEEALRFWTSYYPALTESAELYRVRCLACHGASGAGDGPTGRFLEPPPRDFRAGLFKWARVEWSRRPQRSDLLRVLENGVEGTAMPSFRRLTRGELEGLVDWVRLLSLRGETESVAATLGAREGDVRHGTALQAYELVWGRWDDAGEHIALAPALAPRPSEMTAARIAHGAELFRGAQANCASCHGAGGRGDGEAIWEDGPNGERVRRPDAWGDPSLPRDLTAGLFRGGDAPADLFRRIKYGIGGTIMPAADASLTDDDVWDLAYFVLSLSEKGAELGLAEAPR